jgi:structural maintenance of chromosome 1
MDAVCFVLGVQAPSLRGTQLRDLVYRATTDGASAADDSCSVALVLSGPEDGDVEFKRSIVAKKDSAASVYRINGKKVKAEAYEERLKEFNILTRAKNFLVFQGDVASIGGGSGNTNMVLTKLFEQVSGSAELEARYEELRVAKEKAEEATLLNFQKKRGMDAEKKQFAEQEEEAARYTQLQDELRALKEEQLLFEVSYVNTQLLTLADELATAQARLSESEAELETSSRALEAAEKELGKAKRQRLQQEGSVTAKLKEHSKINPNVVDLRKQVEHLTKKMERARDNDATLQREHDTQSEELQQLERQLFELQQAKKDWEVLFSYFVVLATAVDRLLACCAPHT